MKKSKILMGDLNRSHALSLFALFLVFAFALSFVNVADSQAPITGKQVNDGFVSNLFSNWETGNVDVNVTKYLLFFILILFIFSVLNITGIPPYVAVQWLVSIMVSFLAIAFITPSEVFTILTAYTAFGITFSMAVPFIVMLLASSAILSPIRKKGHRIVGSVNRITVGKVVMVATLWYLLTGFLIYKLISGYGNSVQLSTGMTIVMFTFAGFSVLIAIFNKQFRRWFFKIGLEIKKSEMEMARELRKEVRKDDYEEHH